MGLVSSVGEGCCVLDEDVRTSELVSVTSGSEEEEVTSAVDEVELGSSS